jgi:putative heme transporter
MGPTRRSRARRSAARNRGVDGNGADDGRRARPVRVVLSLVLAAALLLGVLPRLADLSEVWATLQGLSRGWLLVLLAGAAWNIATYQFVMMSALPGLSMGKAFVAGQLSTALANTLPAGAVVGVGVTYTVLRSFGHGPSSIAVAATLTGVWNTFVKLGLPVVALALLAFTGGRTGADDHGRDRARDPGRRGRARWAQPVERAAGAADR